METKKITILQKDFEEMEGLYDSFYEIYGNRNTVWDLQDLDEMRIIGQKFMGIFAPNFYDTKRKTIINY